MLPARNWLLLSIVYLVCALTVAARLNCQDLDIIGAPVLGSDLPYCQLEDTLQCCTRHHLMKMKDNITTNLITGLQKDLHTTVMHWIDAYSTTTATIDEFLVIFLGIFPFPHHLAPTASYFLNNSVKPTLIHQLHPNYTVDSKFDFEGYITNFTTVLIEIFTQNIPYSLQDQQCLDGLLHDHISLKSIEDTGAGLRHLQNIFQSLHKIKRFLNDLLDLISFSFSDQCLDAIIKQYCSHCVQIIPLLCESVCGPVVAACQSPVYDSLQPQLNALWGVSRQLLHQTQSLMNCTLQQDTFNILSPSTLQSIASQSLSKCHIDLIKLLSQRKKRSITGISIPQHLGSAVTKMSSVTGVFSYGSNNIPNFCQSRVTSTDCWNGSSVIAIDLVVHVSLPLSIEQQRNNNVYNFDTEELYQQAVLVGNPVITFLQGIDFLTTLPNGISIPNITIVTAPPTVAVPTNTSLTTDDISRFPTLPPILLIYPNTTSSFHQLNQLTMLLIFSFPLILMLLDRQ